MTTPEVRSKLFTALMAYDARQAKKPHYNRWALPQYLARLTEIIQDIDAGADIRAAVTAGFTGRIGAICLKALGMPPLTSPNEGQGTGWTYQPVSERK